MDKFISVVWDEGIVDENKLVESIINVANMPLTENNVEYIFGETEQGAKLLRIAINKNLSEHECDILAEKLANRIFETGIENFDLEFTTDGVEIEEETYHSDEFFEEYGVMWYNEDEVLDEAKYQGRTVPLGKPMRGDVKKFKVYVKKPGSGNVVKVNFGDPNMKIKKSNPERRRSFRARHNCDNPGPRHRARYWSCRKW
jgi:hypothetical protein